MKIMPFSENCTSNGNLIYIYTALGYWCFFEEKGDYSQQSKKLQKLKIIAEGVSTDSKH